MTVQLRLDICARNFWTAGQDTFFDIRVFHPNAPSNRSRRLSAVYKRHEDEKKRTYGQRILEIEHGVFTPLVMSTPGGMGREAQTFYKRLADKLAQKKKCNTASNGLAKMQNLLCMAEICNVEINEKLRKNLKVYSSPLLAWGTLPSEQARFMSMLSLIGWFFEDRLALLRIAALALQF